MPDTAVTPRNDCSSVAFCRAFPSAKGAEPCAVPQRALAAIRKLTAAAPAASKRMAPQSTNGKTPNANTSARINQCEESKITKALPPAPSSRSANSTHRRPPRTDSSSVNVSASGVTINTPKASPHHHISHEEAKPDQALTRASNNTVAPTVALMAVPQNA